MTKEATTTKPKKTKVPVEAQAVVAQVRPLASGKNELMRRLYEIANDPSKADEFEKLRLELDAMGGN